MIRNFFLVTFRNIARQKLYSIINILGLTIGISAGIMLLLYVQDELNYDGMHTRKDRIYRVNTIASIQDTELNLAQTMAPMGPALKNDYSEVETYTRIRTIDRELVKKDDQQFYEQDFYLTDSTFFDVFDIKLLNGNPKTALAAPESIVLSESLARKYFGEEDPVGQVLKTGAEEWPKTITGVMQDPIPGTHIKPKGLISFTSLPKEQRIFWGNINDYLYLVLQPGTDYKDFERHFPDVYDKYIDELFRQFGATASFTLTPFTDIHLRNGKIDGPIEPGGSMTYVYAFSAIAFFIILIACINYMNMATARATSRAKEVGLRKVMGSYCSQLKWQFVMESLLITFMSTFLALMVVSSAIPFFNELSGKSITTDLFIDPQLLMGVAILSLAIGLISGSYPAIYLSSFMPTEVLKRNLSGKSGNANLRKSLVVVQFAISLVMIICTVVVYNQLQFMNNKELGFNKDQVLKISLNGSAARNKYSVLRNLLLQNPNIEEVASGEATPGGNNLNIQGIGVETENGEIVDRVFQTFVIDQYYLSTLDIPVVQGRNFLQNVGKDTSNAVIVNEQMVWDMGWSDPIGKKFSILIGQDTSRREAKVVGVIRDFHVRDLKEPIEPLVVHFDLNNGFLVTRLKLENLDETLQFIEKTWSEVIPERPLEYTFIE
ncbi:MAG: ABC transporter permease [Bacteroidetes bacterium]|nr:ABC transporter permease [Bacteroidota bacterium]MDA1120421.1 ABC transporter permease [Bacteroidota bacterium]